MIFPPSVPSQVPKSKQQCQKMKATAVCLATSRVQSRNVDYNYNSHTMTGVYLRKAQRKTEVHYSPVHFLCISHNYVCIRSFDPQYVIPSVIFTSHYVHTHLSSQPESTSVYRFSQSLRLASPVHTHSSIYLSATQTASTTMSSFSRAPSTFPSGFLATSLPSAQLHHNSS